MHVAAHAADLPDETEMLPILGFAFTMVTGGNDTTTGLLSGAAELLTDGVGRQPRQIAQRAHAQQMQPPLQISR